MRKISFAGPLNGRLLRFARAFTLSDTGGAWSRSGPAPTARSCTDLGWRLPVKASGSMKIHSMV